MQFQIELWKQNELADRKDGTQLSTHTRAQRKYNSIFFLK